MPHLCISVWMNPRYSEFTNNHWYGSRSTKRSLIELPSLRNTPETSTKFRHSHLQFFAQSIRKRRPVPSRRLSGFPDGPLGASETVRMSNCIGLLPCAHVYCHCDCPIGDAEPLAKVPYLTFSRSEVKSLGLRMFKSQSSLSWNGMD
jgi:hypothetical protein